jgi:tetratricopeptide (TPR) repeat protein
LANALNEDYETNRKTEALENYKKALKLDPTSIEIYFKIASIYRIRNQQKEAIQSYKRVIEQDPTTKYAKDAKRSILHIEKSSTDVG